MKDPGDAHHSLYLDRHNQEICAEDGKPWPCKTWRKWTKSSDYRIAELERLLGGLAREVAQMQGTLSGLRTEARHSALLTAAQMEWLAGLNRTTGHMAGIEVRREVEEMDVSSAFTNRKARIPTRKSFEVRYGDGEWKS